jgi:hypothetical protein
MKLKFGFHILLSSFLLLSCISTEKAQRRLKLSVLGGYNYGGMVENTDLNLVPNVQATPESSVDAFSGATIGGANVGLHLNKPLRYGEIETGIDYMYNYQTYSYADQGNMFIGVRKFHVNQIMLPLTYNFVLFKRSMPNAHIQIKLGVLGQINLIDISDAGLTALPEYSINKFSSGATFGVSATPFMFQNGSKLGFYLDAYRGNRIYKDYYNQANFEMPGSAFVKFGIKYQFKQF